MQEAAPPAAVAVPAGPLVLRPATHGTMHGTTLRLSAAAAAAAVPARQGRCVRHAAGAHRSSATRASKSRRRSAGARPSPAQRGSVLSGNATTCGRNRSLIERGPRLEALKLCSEASRGGSSEASSVGGAVVWGATNLRPLRRGGDGQRREQRRELGSGRGCETEPSGGSACCCLNLLRSTGAPPGSRPLRTELIRKSGLLRGLQRLLGTAGQSNCKTLTAQL